jgi:NAD(P)H-flavin reductase
MSVLDGANEECQKLHMIIESRGGTAWTQRLVDWVKRGTIKDTTVRLIGPYGQPSVSFLDYPVAVLVGGGCGVSPIMSIWRSLANHPDLKKSPLTKVVFAISARDAAFLKWVESELWRGWETPVHLLRDRHDGTGEEEKKGGDEAADKEEDAEKEEEKDEAPVTEEDSPPPRMKHGVLFEVKVFWTGAGREEVSGEGQEASECVWGGVVSRVRPVGH